MEKHEDDSKPAPTVAPGEIEEGKPGPGSHNDAERVVSDSDVTTNDSIEDLDSGSTTSSSTPSPVLSNICSRRVSYRRPSSDALDDSSSADCADSDSSDSSAGEAPDNTRRTSIYRHLGRLCWNPERDLEKSDPKKKLKKLEHGNMGSWVLRHHRQGLVKVLKPHKPSFVSMLQNWGKKVPAPDSSNPPRKRFRINLAEAQRMRVRKLHCKMVWHLINMRVSGVESADWDVTLEKYTKALQDYDYMHNRSKSARDPFLATGEYAVDDFVIDTFGKRLNYEELNKVSSLRTWQDDLRDNLNQRHYPPCGTRSGNESQLLKHGLWTRIILATVGGAFLIAPMWIMVLNGGLYSTLGTTTGCVAIFGLVMAFMLDEGKMCWVAPQPMRRCWLSL